MGRRGHRTREMVEIAKKRIELLFSLAQRMAEEGNPGFSDRYVDLAFRIGTRYNVRIPGRYRSLYCRNCHSYLLSGTSSRVRLNSGRLTVTCLRCGHCYRRPYLREKKAKRGGTRIA